MKAHAPLLQEHYDWQNLTVEQIAGGYLQHLKILL